MNGEKAIFFWLPESKVSYNLILLNSLHNVCSKTRIIVRSSNKP